MPVRYDQASNPTGCPLPPAWPLTPLIRAGRHVDPRGGYPDQPVYDWSEFTDPDDALYDALYDEPHVDPRGEALEAVAAAARGYHAIYGCQCSTTSRGCALVAALAALDAQQ